MPTARLGLQLFALGLRGMSSAPPARIPPLAEGAVHRCSSIGPPFHILTGLPELFGTLIVAGGGIGMITSLAWASRLGGAAAVLAIVVGSFVLWKASREVLTVRAEDNDVVFRAGSSPSSWCVDSTVADDEAHLVSVPGHAMPRHHPPRCRRRE